MTIEKFAEQYRLRIRHVPGDGGDRGDPRISGKISSRDGVHADRQLYFDNGSLCLMLLDCAPGNRSRWQALGGKLWLGDISPDSTGRRVQDVKVIGIPLENAKLAMRLARVRPKREASEAQRAILAAARQKLKPSAGQDVD